MAQMLSGQAVRASLLADYKRNVAVAADDGHRELTDDLLVATAIVSNDLSPYVGIIIRDLLAGSLQLQAGEEAKMMQDAVERFHAKNPGLTLSDAQMHYLTEKAETYSGNQKQLGLKI